MKVAIVGGHPTSQMLAPFEDPEWEIWVLGNQLQDYDGKRVTRVFEIHNDLSDKPEGYAKWLREQTNHLIVGGNGIDGALYPEEEVNKILGGEFLSSSPAYMMGMAILEGAEEIAIYGVDMAVDNHEYFKQRPEMYAWIAYAKGKGIKITIPEESSLFKGTYVEGRDWNKKETGLWSEGDFNKLMDAHQRKMNDIEAQIKALQTDFTSHDGARQVYDRLAKVARAIDAGVNIKTLLETTKVL